MSHIDKVREAVSTATGGLAVDRLDAALGDVLDLAAKLYAEEHPAGRAFADQILATVGPPLGVPLEFGQYGVLVDRGES